MKNYLKVSSTGDDTLIDSINKGARKVLEEHCNKAFITQTIRQTHDYGNAVIRLRLPVQSITSVTDYDAEETATTLTLNTDYYKNSYTGELYKIAGRWPTTPGRWPTWPQYAQVIYIAGYGATSTSVPEGIKTCIKRLGAYLYQHRTEFLDEANYGDGGFNLSPDKIPQSIRMLAAPYKVLRTL